jgi:hypothetical protein
MKSQVDGALYKRDRERFEEVESGEKSAPKKLRISLPGRAPSSGQQLLEKMMGLVMQRVQEEEEELEEEEGGGMYEMDPFLNLMQPYMGDEEDDLDEEDEEEEEEFDSEEEGGGSERRRERDKTEIEESELRKRIRLQQDDLDHLSHL